MKLLLTSAGVANPSIRAAMEGLLTKPVEESTALVVPTAMWGHPMVGPVSTWELVAGRSDLHLVDLGWRSVGLLELTALPGIGRDRWEPWVRDADVLLVGGGDALYLHHWLHESGLAAVLPTLTDTVWVGLSAGSMVLTPRIGADFVEWRAPSGTDETLGVVDFSVFPHLDHPDLSENTTAAAERWAADLGGPAYAIDDATAIRVVDGEVDVVSEGSWRRFG